MLASQIILPAVIIFIIFKTIKSYQRGEMPKSFTAFWLLFWFTILFLIFQPDFLSSIAHLLGIGRGVDLALYLSTIVIFYMIYRIFVRLDKFEKNITHIIREMALKNPKRSKD